MRTQLAVISMCQYIFFISLFSFYLQAQLKLFLNKQALIYRGNISTTQIIEDFVSMSTSKVPPHMLCITVFVQHGM